MPGTIPCQAIWITRYAGALKKVELNNGTDNCSYDSTQEENVELYMVGDAPMLWLYPSAETEKFDPQHNGWIRITAGYVSLRVYNGCYTMDAAICASD